MNLHTCAHGPPAHGRECLSFGLGGLVLITVSREKADNAILTVAKNSGIVDQRLHPN